MALSKTIEVSNNGVLTGVNATYWAIENVDARVIKVRLQCKLNGYISSAAFSANKGPIAERSYEAAMPGTWSTLTGAQQLQTVYDYIKTQPEFTGAADVA